jgi:hypothetical protein
LRNETQVVSPPPNLLHPRGGEDRGSERINRKGHRDLHIHREVNRMKRYLPIFALMGLAALLVSCGSSGMSTDGGQSVEAAAAPTATVAQMAPTDTPPPPPTATTAPPTDTPEPAPTDAPPEPIAPPATPPALASPADVQRISLADAQALLDSGAGVLYDTRAAAQYNISHATGAVSFPEADAAVRLGELPDDRDLIFYCT